MKKTLSLLRILAAVLLFLVIFFAFQAILRPKFINESTTMVDGYRHLEENSLDILFLGSSQMFSGIDSGRLNDQYGISSYNFGASSQPLITTEYYLEEALKTQSPNTVMLELCMIFNDLGDDAELTLAWSYSPMRASLNKFRSVYRLTGEYDTAFIHTFCPLFIYHSRWADINGFDLMYYFRDFDYSSRGFFPKDTVREVELAYLCDEYGENETIPEDAKSAIISIARLCETNNINLVFFKTPCPAWTQAMSYTVRAFMNENNLEYFDMNEYYEEIGIDEKTDFMDGHHMNRNGAEKTTDFIAYCYINGRFPER